MRSLLTRLTVLQQLTTLVAIAAFAFASLWVTAHVMRSERKAFVRETAERLAKDYEGDLKEEESDPVTAAQSLLEDGHDVGMEVEVRDANGRVLATSLSPPDSIAAASSGRRKPLERYVSRAKNDLGVEVTVVGTDAVRQASLSALGRSLLIAAVPILAIGLLVGRGLVARALRPLSAMADQAAALSVDRNPRSLGIRTEVAEVDRLAASFDRLLERLDDALRAERRLTADASHELRTPLTVLDGELALLLEGAPAGASTTLALERAADQVRGMRELVEALLLLHRSRELLPNGAGEFEVLNLCDLTREACAEVRARHAGRVSDLGLVTPDEVLVSGHAALLAAAVRNLLDNAFKFTREGDRVEVTVSQDGSRATISVDDAGRGVREHERGRIFDAFYRGAEARAGGSGFGLGLPMLRRVARAHGGDAEVTDSALGGARFVLWLPRLGDGAATPAAG